MGSYSCGSTFGLMSWVTCTPSPPTLRTKSATSGVVATTDNFCPSAGDADVPSSFPEPQAATTDTVVTAITARIAQDADALNNASSVISTTETLVVFIFIV